jgi:hypothetical protein
MDRQITGALLTYKKRKFLYGEEKHDSGGATDIPSR